MDDDLDFAISLSMQEMREREKPVSKKSSITETSSKTASIRTGGFVNPSSSGTSSSSTLPLASVNSTAKVSHKSEGRRSENSIAESIGFGSVISGLIPSEFKLTSSCFRCHGQFGVGSYLNVNGHKYHQGCFVCDACGQPITEAFVKNKNSSPDEDIFYHSDCYNLIFTPTCCVCSCPMNGRFLRHSYFKDMQYCISHESNRFCFSCNRKEPTDPLREPFQILPDGRALCFECISSSVLDSMACLPIYREVVDFMEFHLGLRIPHGMRDVSVLAVDMSTLNEQRQNGILSFHRKRDSSSLDQLDPVSVIRGLTISSRSEIRHYVSNRSGQFNGTVSFVSDVFQTEEIREVSAVLVLVGLPRDLTASILAHEAMHVWIKLSKDMPFDLSPSVEEGLCQFIAAKYLEYLDLDGSHSTNSKSWSEQLRQYFRYQIEMDTSPVYGDGFREAANCCSELGLDVVIDYVRDNKSLPNLS